jgi:hypothetical protein
VKSGSKPKTLSTSSPLVMGQKQRGFSFGQFGLDRNTHPNTGREAGTDRPGEHRVREHRHMHIPSSLPLPVTNRSCSPWRVLCVPQHRSKARCKPHLETNSSASHEISSPVNSFMQYAWGAACTVSSSLSRPAPHENARGICAGGGKRVTWKAYFIGERYCSGEGCGRGSYGVSVSVKAAG